MRSPATLLVALSMVAFSVDAQRPPAEGIRIEFCLASNKSFPNSYRAARPGTTDALWVSKDVIVSTSDIVDATSYPRDQWGYAIQIKLSPEAGRRLLQVSSRHLHEQMAFIVDGQVVSALNISKAIGDEFAIYTGEDEALAKRIVRALIVHLRRGKAA